MKKVLFLFVLIILNSYSFAQIHLNIFENLDENNIVLNQEQKTYLNGIKKQNNLNKIQLVRLNTIELERTLETVSLSLPDKHELIFNNIKKTKVDFERTYIFCKKDLNFISFIVKKEDITGTIQIWNKQFSIIPLGNGLHSIIEVDYSKYKPEAEPIEIKGKSKLRNNNVSSATSAVIDVLVVYTPSARNAVPDIIGIIQNAVSLANTAFSTDNIDLRYNLVYTGELSYSEGSKTMGQVLSEFSTNSSVQTLKLQYSADICFLVTNGNSFSGISYLGGEYCIGNYDRVRDTYTFAHETGHSLSCRHNIEEEPTTGYNHGYLYTPGQWCTIMSYFTTETRLNVWSNPLKTVQGTLRGNVLTADNARNIFEKMSIVASNSEPQLSGVLSHNQYFIGRSYSLNGNLTIPNGITLTIQSSSVVNLNGYYIASTGGVINIENGAVINNTGIVKLNDNGNIKGIFSTLHSAVNYSTVNQVFEINGQVSCTGNISIQSGCVFNLNSGAALTFSSGATINFSNTATINIYGVLNALNVTFDFSSPNSSTQNGLKFYPGSYCNMENCTVRNAWYGVYHNNAGGVIIGFNIYNCYYGIYKYNGFTTIGGNNLSNNTIGIALYNSDSEIFNNIISYNSLHGVYCASGSNAKFGVLSAHGNNNIHHNSYQGIYCYNNSYPNIGIDDPNISGGWDGGWNIIEQNGSHNVHFAVDGILYAEQNWWGNNPPEVNKMYAQNGTIVYSPYLTSAPIMKINTSETPNPIMPISLFELSDNGCTLIIDKVIKLITASNYVLAREICIDIINNYPDSLISYNALSLLSKTYDKSNKESLNSIYALLFNNKSNKKLYAIAGLMLARNSSNNKIQKIDEVIEKYSGEEVVEYAYIDKFLYYFNEEQDRKKAIEMSKELDQLFPKSEAALDAHRMLGNINIIENDNDNLKLRNKSFEANVGLLNNYPNPFNPTTEIKYSLPKAGKVSLVIYDILGREVTTLVNQIQEPGYYSTTFNGSNYASGVYIARIIVNSADKQAYIKTIKMLMTK
jgi:hypothetical protein